MTDNRIEARQFSLVDIELDAPLEFVDYVIFDPSKPQAFVKSKTFAKKVFGERVKEVRVYPRSYVKKVRELVARGRVIE